ncbi:HP1 family phage holin [Brenneria goodwinii]|uniref:HP1 family phage holin n=1 Tax=Brenneria goodwinii TaxID=1109412 RepID=UPI000BAFBAFA|nr:HP1 family phage holin [Brenneria goodwinii]
MRRMSTIYSRLSYGTGAGLTGAGVSEKTYSAATSPSGSWLIVETISGLTLSDWAIIVGIICTAGTFAVNWYYRRKEFQLKSGDV